MILYSVLAPGAGDQRASPQEPWLVEPPVSDGFKVVLRRLLSLNPEGNYPDARSLMEDLQRVAEGGMPFALPSGGGGARGRRSESAIPQDLIRAELFERVKRAGESASDLEFVAPPAQDVLVEVEPEVGDEKGFGESTFADDMPDFPEPVGDRPSKVSSRRLKAPAARSRSDRAEIVPRKKGGGWAVFGFALLVVLGGGGVGVGVARPVGVELGQTLLGRAEAALAEGKPDYSVAWAQTEQGLDAGKRDVGLVRELIGLQRGIERRAEHERLGLHPEGKETRDPAALKPILAALELLLIRTRGLPAEFLVQFDIYLGEKQGNRHFWGELADNLLAVGEVDEALVAYMKAGSKKGEALARHALTELAFLPGGAYVVRDAGEAGKEIFGHREPSYVGRTEVTRGQYTSFLRATAKLEDKHTHCDMQLEPVDKDHTPKGWTPGVDAEVHLPATGVDMHDAVAYCAWRGGTLIDPESFAAAARGRLGFEYPWGKGAPTLGFVNAGGLLGGVAPSGCFPGGAGEGGSLDLLGSVEEWTTQVDGGRSALYGGHYDTALDQVSVSASGDAALDERRATLGFRLLRFVKAPAR